METNTKRKTCASCAAYDETESTCHRYPPEFSAGGHFPHTVPNGWCSMHATVVDENGWREDWPEQDKLIEFIRSHSQGVKNEQIAKHFPSVKPVDVRKALNRLRFGGVISHSFGTYSVKQDTISPAVGIQPPTPRKPSGAEILAIFPLGRENAITVLRCQRIAMDSYFMSKGQFNDLRFNLMTEGAIKRDEDGKYFTPSVDDMRNPTK